MKTAVMTDSNSGISSVEAKERGIWSIDMPILVNGEECFQGVNITHEEFFEALAADVPVSTSQPSPGAVSAMWDEILASGYDSIVYIPMTAGLSNSCQSAQFVAAEYGGRVRVVDNRRISVTQRMSVLDAIKMANQGMPASQICAELEQRSTQSRVFLAVDTLKYLVRGGRATPAAAALGSLLNVKPVLSIQTERIEPFAKERGMKKAVMKLFSSTSREIKKNLKIKPDRAIIGVAGAGISQETADGFLLAAREEFPEAYVFYDELPLSIATHTGPGALGIGVQPKFD